MGVNRIQQHIVNTPQELSSISGGNSSARSIKLTALQTNISKELEATRTMVDKVTKSKRIVALQTLQETLGEVSGNKVDLSKVVSFLNDLPESTQKLFKEYLDLFAELPQQKDSKWKLTQKEFEEILKGKLSFLGEGGFGAVYGSADGKYALKFPNSGYSMGEDKEKNEALSRNAQTFDPNQLYYNQKDDFITRYVGTFETEEGIEVAVFEKIDGQDFDKCNADTPAKQIRLLAQAATAIAISHEAGCPNSDVKPRNMMITKDLSLLKLVDQGGLIDLIQPKIPKYKTYTRRYCAPEVIFSFYQPDQRDSFVTPACDVYSMGVSILEKLEGITTKENGAKIEAMIKELHEDLPDNRYRYYLAGRIADWCRINTIIPGDKAGSEFIGLLLKDCLAFNPEDRISAAQLAEILQVFSSYLEAKETNPTLGCPDYSNVKAIAIKDCPKGIPIAIRKLLFDADEKIQSEAVYIIYMLASADISYADTPSYGLSCVLGMELGIYDNNAFEVWLENRPEIAQELKERIYIQGQAHSDKQDMPVSEEIYKIISSAIVPEIDRLESE